MFRLGWSRLTSFLCSASLAACTASAPPASAPQTVSVPAAQTSGPVELATNTTGGAHPTWEPLPVGTDDPVWGSANAPVTIVEFSDLQCPFCARVHPTLQALEAKYGPSQLRIVFKHNPLPFHPNAR